MIPGPVQFSNPPPPIIPNMSFPPPVPPPTNITNPMSGPPPSFAHPHHFSSHGGRGGGHRHFFQPFRPYMRPGPGGAQGAALDEFDGKRLRKSVMRKTVDYNSAIIKALECRVWQRDYRDRRALQPDVTYYPNLEPPPSYVDNPINAVVTRFVKTATNKMRCPIFCMAWTPEGRRLVTGASSGEFTLWNGLTFNFETILQAHDSPVRTMVWSHNDTWMVTGDHMGYVKYWQSNMNNVKMFQAHKEAIRGLSFSPTDQKFVTCSDDGTLRIWDFARCHEERILRGHGADVKCVHWHPQKALIVSGSKDNQQPIKLWDPKTGTSLATLHAHKSTVMDIKWNDNGNWLVTASRDHLLKLFDIRNLSSEVQTFRGHKKEASSVAWHPSHEGLFCSGGSDGAILFWHVGADKEMGGIEQAHDSIVWTLAWHPLGHILCSGSNDHTSKFWTRNRPGDQMRDKYNLNTLPAGLAGMEDQDMDDMGIIPGMGPEDKVEETEVCPVVATIPGLDFEGVEDKNKQFHKKVPYSKPIPKNFVAQWNETGPNEDDSGNEGEDSLQLNPIAQALRAVIENTKIAGCIPIGDLKPEALIMFGKMTSVKGDEVLTKAIAAGGDTLQRLVESGQIEQFQDVIPQVDSDTYSDVDLEDNREPGPGTMPDIELPPPLPSSIFAKKGGPVATRKSRFSEPEPIPQHQSKVAHDSPFPTSGDQDMRSLGGFHPGYKVSPYGDQDLRVLDTNFGGANQEDEDLRILRDIDLREEMLKKANKYNSGGHHQGGPPPGHFQPQGGGFRDVDARIQPPQEGGWPQQQQQRWGPNDPIRPGLNNFGTRNFVSSGNFQNQSGNFAPNNGNPEGSVGSNYVSSSGKYPNAPVGSFPKSISTGNFGGPGKGSSHPADPRGTAYGGNTPDSQFGGEDDGAQGSWMSVDNQGLQMGPRPQMGPGSMGPRMQMGPRPQMGPRHQLGPGGPQMGHGGPQMGPGGPQMGPGGPQMGPGGPQMGPRPPMGPGGQGPPFPNQPFFRGRGGFGRSRGGFDSSRGGFDSSRGGFDNSRGGFDNSRGGFDNSRGGYDGSHGGFDNGRGGYDKTRGGFEGGRGGFDKSRAGFDGNRSGFENKRGGFDNSRFDNSRGDFDSGRGGFEKVRGRGGPRGRFPGPRGSRGPPRGGRPSKRERESESPLE